MKEEQTILALDMYEEGAIITALNDLRNKKLIEQKPTDFLDDLMLKILNAPQKKVKVKNEAR